MGLELVPEEDPERHWTVQELAENLRESQTKIREAVKAGEFGPYIDTARSGDKIRPRVPESGRQAYIAARTIHPRRSA